VLGIRNGSSSPLSPARACYFSIRFAPGAGLRDFAPMPWTTFLAKGLQAYRIRFARCPTLAVGSAARAPLRPYAPACDPRGIARLVLRTLRGRRILALTRSDYNEISKPVRMRSAFCRPCPRFGVPARNFVGRFGPAVWADRDMVVVRLGLGPQAWDQEQTA